MNIGPVQIKGGWFLRILGWVIAWNSMVISPRTRPECGASLCRAPSRSHHPIQSMATWPTEPAPETEAC